MERSLYSAYGALFVAGEGITLYLAYYLKASGETLGVGIIAIVGIGIIFAALVLRFCYLTGTNADRWKNKILEVTQGTDMEEDFRHWKTWWYRLYQKTRGRMRLVWMVLLFIFILGLWYCIVC